LRVFLYEFATGGGLIGQRLDVDGGSNLAELTVEGQAMLVALAEDFAKLPDTQVVTLRDARLRALSLSNVESITVASFAEHDSWCSRLAAEADWTLVIAPETDGLLEACCQRLAAARGRLLNCSPATLALAADKQATAERLAAAGVPVPRGVSIAAGDRWPTHFTGPIVIKPRDGVGAMEVERLDDAGVLARRMPPVKPMRVEAYCPGIAASVLFICGPAGCTPLAPCRQQIETDAAGRLSYRGGSLLVDRELAERATRLAEKALKTLRNEECKGFVGVDLVLGNASDGRDDCVIEINPRLTTSYVGLRQVARSSLAAALVDAASGKRPHVEFDSQELHFTADGQIFYSLDR